MSIATPRSTVRAPHHMVASADQLATSAGLAIFAQGGNAVDAAIATNAAIAVTGPHLCGIGGDLFALIHIDDPAARTRRARPSPSTHRAGPGSGADPAALRAEGFTEMPFKLDVRSVTVPGCVDGWMALHERFGSLPLDVILAPARRLAAEGFPGEPAAGRLASPARRRQPREPRRTGNPGDDDRGHRPTPRCRARARRPSRQRTRRLLPRRVRRRPARTRRRPVRAPTTSAPCRPNWIEPLTTTAFGVDLHTIGPNSQGYLTLGGARLAEQLDLPDDPDDERWAHLLIEAATAAGFDRPDALHDSADGDALLARSIERLDLIGLETASRRAAPGSDGDTTYLCTAGIDRDGRRIGVSLIQSNASGFGSHLVEPNTGINLHNRGIGFNLVEGHPAEFGPGRRPPHTLSPAFATRRGASRRCSARWAATPSRRSCSRSPPGCSITASRRPQRSTPPAGSSTAPTPASTPGPAPAVRWSTSRATPRRLGRRAGRPWPPQRGTPGLGFGLRPRPRDRRRTDRHVRRRRRPASRRRFRRRSLTS